MKAGDTAYLVESNRFVHEVEILRCNGELYIVCFKDNGVGLYGCRTGLGNAIRISRKCATRPYNLLLSSLFFWCVITLFIRLHCYLNFRCIFFEG